MVGRYKERHTSGIVDAVIFRDVLRSVQLSQKQAHSSRDTPEQPVARLGIVMRRTRIVKEDDTGGRESGKVQSARVRGLVRKQAETARIIQGSCDAFQPTVTGIRPVSRSGNPNCGAVGELDAQRPPTGVPAELEVEKYSRLKKRRGVTVNNSKAYRNSVYSRVSTSSPAMSIESATCSVSVF
jgi:hypothetical protein